MTKIKSDSPQKLTLLNLSNLDKQNDEVVTVFLADGKFQLEINKKFRPTLIQKLLLDYQDAFTVIRKETNVTVDDVSNMLLIYHMLIVKYFTNLGLKSLDCSKKKDIEKLLAVANQLLDSGVFKELLGAFDPIELGKIEQAIKDSKQMSSQMGELFTSIALTEQEKINAEQELAESEVNGHNESEPIAEGTPKED